MPSLYIIHNAFPPTPLKSGCPPTMGAASPTSVVEGVGSHSGEGGAEVRAHDAVWQGEPNFGVLGGGGREVKTSYKNKLRIIYGRIIFS